MEEGLRRSEQDVKIDFSAARELPTGVTVLNCTPHPLIFRCGEDDILVVPCGSKLSAKAVEEVVGKQGEAQIVRTVFHPTEEGIKELEEIKQKRQKALIIGSMLSAQAYRGQVVGIVPASGFERVPPEQRRVNPYKFTTF